MGWFPTGHNDDQTGDLPAEIIQLNLAEYGETSQAPSLLQFLCAVEQVLRGNEAQYLDAATKPDWPVGRLRHRQNEKADDVDVSDDLRDATAKILEMIAYHYDLAMERNPRISEILAAIIFAAQANRASILSDGEALALSAGDLVELR